MPVAHAREGVEGVSSEITRDQAAAIVQELKEFHKLADFLLKIGK